MTGVLHAVVPAGVDDPARPSGGNVYDRRVLDGLRACGWQVEEHQVEGAWPTPDVGALAGLARVLGDLPEAALVLVDGLIASSAAVVLPGASSRLRTVVLVHMPLGPDAGEEAVLSGASAVVTTSRATRDRLRQWYALRRVQVCEPGADRAPLATGSGTDGALLCVAAVHRGKGHDLLLDALAEVGDQPWTLTCVGSLEVDPIHVERLQQKVYARRWEGRVRFVGPLGGRSLEAAYDVADLVVLASRAESYGMVLTEALAHGLPVVATRVGGVAEAVGRALDGSAPGLLVAPDDTAALASALGGWLSDGDLRRRLAAAAASRRTGLRPWSATAADLAAVLTQVDHRVQATAGTRR
ncbi:glycosyltransferase family 4 protein [Nocardioides cynanchi]|uniref:glycosyltransferase family 4 protein n=1 Tax=Nocardioides cynanchi TaxID=2558918 RepID=UPI00124871C9|nr:glycosyltransferase family 4 protein [Nocardioides cynanchi]